MDQSEDYPVGSKRADDEFQAVDALLDTADSELIWRVLDHAHQRAVSIADAYHDIVHDAPETGDHGAL